MTDWADVTVTLDDARANDGTRTGQMAIHGTRFYVKAWRPGGDRNVVHCQVRPVEGDDPEWDDIVRQITARVSA